MADTAAHDVIEILTDDHRQVLALIETIGSSTDPELQRDMADTVIAELVRHSVAEEMYVYPAMREHLDNGKDEVAHDIEEHKQLEKTMKQLEGVDVGDTDFVQVLSRLEEQLRHHASDEEDEQFPKLRAALSRDDLLELGRKVELAKSIAPTRPHPASPNSELFHKLAGPGVGLVDRLRDRISGRADNV